MGAVQKLRLSLALMDSLAAQNDRRHDERQRRERRRVLWQYSDKGCLGNIISVSGLELHNKEPKG